MNIELKATLIKKWRFSKINFIEEIYMAIVHHTLPTYTKNIFMSPGDADPSTHRFEGATHTESRSLHLSTQMASTQVAGIETGNVDGVSYSTNTDGSQATGAAEGETGKDY